MSKALPGMILALLAMAAHAADNRSQWAASIADAAIKISEKTLQSTGSNSRVRIDGFSLNGIKNLGLSAAVAGELQRLGATVIPPGEPADWAIQGSLVPSESLAGPTSFSIQCEVRQGTTNLPRSNFAVQVSDLRTVQETVANTGETLAPPDKSLLSPLKATVDIRPEEIAAAIVEPVVDTVVRDEQQLFRLFPSKRSPYAVTILGKEVGNQKYRALPIEIVDGQPRVKVKMNQIIGILIENQSDFDAGVKTIVDGVDRFATASDGDQSGRFDLVPKGQTRGIFGWHKQTSGDQNAQKKQVSYAEFQIGSVAESVASQFASHESVGSIQITIAVAIGPEDPLPPHEFVPRGLPNAAIKEGPISKSNVEVLHRRLGTNRAVFRIFYDVVDA